MMRTMTRRERLAFYIRLSGKDRDVRYGLRDESNSITGQRTLLQEFVRNHDEFAGWEITEYFDDGISGSLFAGRGAFQTMLADAKEGKFQCLIVKDFSRLGRNYLEAGNFMEYVFPAMGLRFISVNDHYDSFKRQGMTGGTDVAFKNLIHQMYAMDGSQKVKSAKRVRNARGEYTAGLAPYGYRKDPADVHRFVIEEREAEVVREIFTLAADGYSYTRIARTLNDRGERTPYECRRERQRTGSAGRKGWSDYHVWGMAMVRQIIKNTAYRGQMVQNRYETVGYGDDKRCIETDRENWTVVDGAIPAIVDDELFAAANAGRDRHYGTRPERSGTNLFVCGHCGRRLMKTSQNGRYICPVQKVKSHTDCGMVEMKVEKAQMLTLQTAKDIALVVAGNREYYDRQEKQRIREIDIQTKALEEEKARLEQCVLSSYEDYHNGNVSKEDYMAGRKACRDAIDGIDARLDALWEELHRTVRADDADLADCRALHKYDGDTLAKVIEKVVVHDGRRLEVVFDADDMFWREVKEDAL